MDLQSVKPKLAAYISAFNVVSNGLPYEGPLRKMLAFFDAVCVAVNTSKDNTLQAIKSLDDGSGKLTVIETSFSYKDVTFDGAIKNAALQSCPKGPEWLYVQMDLDEIIPLSQRPLWDQYATQLQSMPSVQCYMIPSVDLWGSLQTIRADKPIGNKFRLHKGGLQRGVWRHAWISYGKRFDTSRSDSTELIDANGDLVRCMDAAPSMANQPSVVTMLRQYPYVLHLGYVDYEQRARINKAVWAEHWTLRNGGVDARVATRPDDLREVPLIRHGLALD